MSANALHIDLPPEDRPSLAPWIVVLLCAAILLVLVSRAAVEIPASLQKQGRQHIDPAEFPNMNLVADGRSLALTGTMNKGQTTQNLIAQLNAIDGVQHVTDQLRVVDPAAIAQIAADKFAERLKNIDISQVSFQAGSTSFTEQSDSSLSQLLTLLKDNPDSRIRIEGHTDNTGPDSVNLRVSRERAQAVANFLIARGIRSDQLIVTGYGASQPIADNSTESGKARNRRIEISPTS